MQLQLHICYTLLYKRYMYVHIYTYIYSDRNIGKPTMASLNVALYFLTPLDVVLERLTFKHTCHFGG